MSSAPTFPIDPLLPDVVATLGTHARLVLEAPPGAGKTTQVPPALLAAPWLEGRIVMLEPRRIATRAAAEFIAKRYGEPVGGTAGYRIRGESKVSAATRIEVVTEAILIGLMMVIAHVPLAGVAAAIVLVLGIAQVPALIVTLPAIAYLWMSGQYGTGAAIAYTIGLVLTGMADNVLKPLLLGRGVDAPMPVILLGALGGMAAAGILGMFVGATLLALGYQIFMRWVAARHESAPADAPQEPHTV